eukprot:SAG31_NODE_4033_length_3648_cov_1.803043_2_plen_164_part_00
MAVHSVLQKHHQLKKLSSADRTAALHCLPHLNLNLIWFKLNLIRQDCTALMHCLCNTFHAERRTSRERVAHHPFGIDCIVFLCPALDTGKQYNPALDTGKQYRGSQVAHQPSASISSNSAAMSAAFCRASASCASAFSRCRSIASDRSACVLPPPISAYSMSV